MHVSEIGGSGRPFGKSGPCAVNSLTSSRRLATIKARRIVRCIERREPLQHSTRASLYKAATWDAVSSECGTLRSDEIVCRAGKPQPSSSFPRADDCVIPRRSRATDTVSRDCRRSGFTRNVMNDVESASSSSTSLFTDTTVAGEETSLGIAQTSKIALINAN